MAIFVRLFVCLFVCLFFYTQDTDVLILNTIRKAYLAKNVPQNHTEFAFLFALVVTEAQLLKQEANCCLSHNSVFLRNP